MKKTLKYNRALASLVLVAVIVIGSVCGIWRTVGSYQNKVEKLYTQTKVLSDLKDLSGYAAKILAGGKTAGIDTSNLEKALDSLDKNIEKPTKLGSAVTDVYTQASLVYNDTYYSGAYDDTTSLTAYMSEIDSTMMRLKHNDDYNTAASKYNTAISKFPASLLTLGKKNAVIFG